MLFNSFEYIFVFLPAALIVYFTLNRLRLATLGKAWLVVASLAFYSWWGLAYLPLITFSILVNYGIGTALGSSAVIRWRRLLLVAGISFNLGLLGFFKYANFFVDNVNALAGADIQFARIALPLAISFFTFQKIAYLVDSYRGETRGYGFLHYALFVTFFPQLIAGPIVHHKEVVPQFSSRWKLLPRYRNIALGLCIFTIGLFKKVMIADTFAKWATHGFDVAPALTFVEAWVTSLSYTFQIYFDFSGYTDMAIGAALMFNIRLPINFNSPYKATSIQDFWRRWHITLSRFLRDYLYIPLGGNRHGEVRTYANLLLTFILGGLWHGASWMFVVWGALHGLALAVHRAWSRAGLAMPTATAWLVTFVFVNVTWIFFRAQDMASARKVLAGMMSIGDGSVSELLFGRSASIGDSRTAGAWIAAAFCIVLLAQTTLEFCRAWRRSDMLPLASGALFAVVILAMSSATARVSEFLYFNF